MRELQPHARADDVRERTPKLVDRFRELPALVAPVLFGSPGTDEETPLSDVDLAVLFREDAQSDGRERVRLTGLASEILRYDDVSLAFLRRSSPPLQHEILRTGRPLRVADEVAWANVREAVVGRYWDFVIDDPLVSADDDAFLRETCGSR